MKCIVIPIMILGSLVLSACVPITITIDKHPESNHPRIQQVESNTDTPNQINEPSETFVSNESSGSTQTPRFSATETINSSHEPMFTPTRNLTTSQISKQISDKTDESLPGYMDVILFTYRIHGEKLEVDMSVRDLPKLMKFNQYESDVGQDNLEYKWGIYIDVDGNRSTGAPHYCSYTDAAIGTEYELDAAYYAERGEDPFEGKLRDNVVTIVGEYLTGSDGDCWGGFFPQDPVTKFKPDQNLISFEYAFPGINEKTKVFFLTAGRSPSGKMVFDELD